MFDLEYERLRRPIAPTPTPPPLYESVVHEDNQYEEPVVAVTWRQVIIIVFHIINESTMIEYEHVHLYSAKRKLGKPTAVFAPYCIFKIVFSYSAIQPQVCLINSDTYIVCIWRVSTEHWKVRKVGIAFLILWEDHLTSLFTY